MTKRFLIEGGSKTISSNSQDQDFNGSLQPLYVGWCQTHGDKKLSIG